MHGRAPTLMRLAGRAAASLLIAGVATVAGVLLAAGAPANDREWTPAQAVLPRVTITDSVVHVRGVRDFRHLGPDSFRVDHDDRTYDLREIDRVWYVLSPFGSDFRGFAHAFLSFSCSDSQFVSVSVEARREVGEEYSTWRGALRNYELMYVVGDERDLIPLRASVWGDPTYVYPGRATPAQARALFLHMMRRAQGLERRPEFYHTISNNCVTNIVDAVNSLREEPIESDRRILLPGFSDELAHELDLIDTGLSIDAARERFRVDSAVAARSIARPDFSTLIRAPR